MRFRNFCFTLHEKGMHHFHLYLHDFIPYTSYIVFQEEQCPTTGSYHYQGYIELNKQVTLKTIKKYLSDSIHIEARKGTAKQASDYCLKLETSVKNDWNPFIYGELSQQGKRSDLEDSKNIIDNGGSLIDLPISHIVRYHRGFEKYIQLNMKHRDFNNPPKVIWITGKSGTGKTRYVYSKHTDIYVKDPSNKWWDGYTQQEVILIDDFRFWSEGIENLLRLLDRYPYQGETKGSNVKINSPYIYITSILTPEECYSGSHANDDKEQLLRRIEIKTM